MGMRLSQWSLSSHSFLRARPWPPSASMGSRTAEANTLRWQFIAIRPSLLLHITYPEYFLSFSRQRSSRRKTMLSFSLYIFRLRSDGLRLCLLRADVLHLSFSRGRRYGNRDCAAKCRGGTGGQRRHHIHEDVWELAMCKSPPKKSQITTNTMLYYLHTPQQKLSS